MVQCTPAVHQVSVYLFEQQSVTCDANTKYENSVLNKQKHYKLTDYFTENVMYDKAATSIKYEDFPVKSVWQSTEKVNTEMS
jgi:hypothetical protein